MCVVWRLEVVSDGRLIVYLAGAALLDCWGLIGLTLDGFSACGWVLPLGLIRRFPFQWKYAAVLALPLNGTITAALLTDASFMLHYPP